MKKIIPIVLASLVLSSMLAFSQKSKVLDKSGKTPKWVNGIEKEYIIVCGSGNSVDAAQDNALLKIKERVVSSIAENVSTSNEYYRGDKSVNGVSNVIENFETSTKTKSADISYIKGISLTKAEEYYWEKVSEGNQIRFYYHVKYPFSDFDLKKMVMDFEKADFELTMELNTLFEEIEKYSSVEEINQGLLSFNALSKAFIDTRKAKADLGVAKLNEMLKSISIVTIQNNLGEIKYQLQLGEKPISAAQKPRVSSNCATITDISGSASEWVIKYDYSGCYDNPANVVNVAYMFGGLKKSFNIDVNADKAEIFIQDVINFTADNTQGPTIEGAKCHITIISKYDSPVIIEKLVLNWDKSAPLILDNLNMQIKGKGKHDLNLIIPQAIEKEKYNATAQNMISGSMLYRAVSGKKSTYELSYQSITTAW